MIAPTLSKPAVLSVITATQQRFAICDLICTRCDRALCCITRHRAAIRFVTRMRPRFPARDYCRWCGRPISATAEQQAPLEGFRAFVHAMLRPEALVH